ncbi:MAG: nucleotidyltransferase [Actinomycetota bacterium]|nr:nucleotidyltransferase [Actinomycetota bacterium]
MSDNREFDNREFTAEDIRRLLTELGRRLHAEGIQATIYVVGGAAMALAVDRRRVTDDIDAIFDHKQTIEHEVAKMATEYGLRDRWLNDAAMSVPHRNEAGTLLEVPGLAISTASPRHLLAMKMAAFRPQDQQDLDILFRTVGISSPEEAVRTVFDVYGLDYAANFGPNEDYVLRARAVLSRQKPAPPPGEAGPQTTGPP